MQDRAKELMDQIADLGKKLNELDDKRCELNKERKKVEQALNQLRRECKHQYGPKIHSRVLILFRGYAPKESYSETCELCGFVHEVFVLPEEYYKDPARADD